jgi:hypothetical protein
VKNESGVVAGYISYFIFHIRYFICDVTDDCAAKYLAACLALLDGATMVVTVAPLV